MREEIFRTLRDAAEITIMAAIILIVMRSMATTYSVRGPSMEPVLNRHERVFVNRLGNLRIGSISLYGQDGFVFGGPSRGDLMVSLPQQPWSGNNIVKRVIGVPGDEINITDDGEVYVNGVLLSYSDSSTAKARLEYPIIVPAGHYFMLGDNRSNSTDSRHWGFLPASEFIGKVWVVFWPLDRFFTF